GGTPPENGCHSPLLRIYGAPPARRVRYGSAHFTRTLSSPAVGHRLLSGESRRTHTASHQRSGQARGSPDWPAPAKRKRGDRLSSSDEQRLDGLVSPIAVKRIDWQRNLVQVELTQQQVKESPNVD